MEPQLTSEALIIETEQSTRVIFLNKICFLEKPHKESDLSPGIFQINIAFGTPAIVVLQFKEKQKRDNFFAALQTAIAKSSLVEVSGGL